MIFLDSETCGLHSVMVLLQIAEGLNGEVELYSLWKMKISKIIKILDRIIYHPEGIVAFNLAFDWFHICKMRTILELMENKESILEDCINEFANKEPLGRDGLCCKPTHALDLMLVARKGVYQSTMPRSDIVIRRVPTALAWELAKELEHRIPLKDIYFAKRKNKFASKWQVMDLANGDPNFKNIVLKFKPSSALKALAADALNYQDLLKYSEIGIDKKLQPNELGYAPFALAIGKPGEWNGAWPSVIKHHIDHWLYDDEARRYAAKDVTLLQELYKYFNSPPMDDDDSILTCMVAAIRWRGFKINISGLKDLRNKLNKNKAGIPTAPSYSKRYIEEALGETEKAVMGGSTKKVVLEEISKFKIPCPDCLNKEIANCEKCNNIKWIRHPAAIRAENVINARKSEKEEELYNKVLLAGRFHVSLSVIGSLSSRMGGGDKLNALGIKKTTEVRSNFPLAWDNQILCGGDFSSFEVTLAEASYKDPDLRKDLLTCEKCKGQMEWNRDKNDFVCNECQGNEGQAIHGLFGTYVFPPMTYDEIKATKGTNNDKYVRAKSAVFLMFYGGKSYTMKDRLGVPEEIANAAIDKFFKKYKNILFSQKRTVDRFSSMKQPGGIGSRVEWHEPAEYMETLLGFRRYFTLENMICKELFNLANKPPKHWKNIKIKVTRRVDRGEQFASGAVASALYGAAFQIQGANVRAAINHEIQGTGAQITKAVQRKIWDLQPNGINDWIVMPFQIHDEIMCPTKPNYKEKVKETVIEAIESFRSLVPLIKMDWQIGLKSWADK